MRDVIGNSANEWKRETRKILLNLLVNNLTLIKVIGTRNQIIFLLKSAFESLARSS